MLIIMQHVDATLAGITRNVLPCKGGGRLLLIQTTIDFASIAKLVAGSDLSILSIERFLWVGNPATYLYKCFHQTCHSWIYYDATTLHDSPALR